MDCIFVSDTHLSDHTWASRAQIVGDSIFGFQQACSLAIHYKCPLIIAGDCWELWRNPNPDSSTVKQVRLLVDSLQQHGCQLYYINGQHDNLTPPFWFESISYWPIHVGGKSFMVGGKKFYGVDFFPESGIETIAADIPSDAFCLVIHQAWVDFTGSEIMAKLKLSQLPPVPLIVSGDMHKFLWCQVGQSLCISPGATHMRSIREPREHYVVGFDFKEGIKQLRIASRPVIEFTVPTEDAWISEFEKLESVVRNTYEDAIRNQYPSEVAKPLIILQDARNSGAATLISEKIQNCHVIQRAAAEQSMSESQGEMLRGQSVEELLPEVLASKGLNQAQMDLIRVVANGGDILAHLGVGVV